MTVQRSTMRLLPILAALSSVLAGFAGAPARVAARSDKLSDRVAPLARLSDAFETIAALVSPAVVQVITTGYKTAGSGASLLTRQSSTGAGVVVSGDGYIMTNAHVIGGGAATRVRVVLPITQQGRSILKDSGKTVDARVVGVDLETDLALLKLDETGLPALELADSDAVAPGQLVLAFGSPLGLTNSVSMGVVSARARQLKPEARMIYIQTDAPINPGNSGGPLVDTTGRVIGINTLIFSQSGGNEGIGFAAPSNIVRSVYQQLREFGRVRRGAVGVHAQTINPALARALGLERSRGVILGDVSPGGPAARAGLRIADLVLTLDGKPMENGRQFDVNIYQKRAGTSVRLVVIRDGRERSFQVPVVERPGDPQGLAEMVDPDINVVEEIGILALDLNERVREMLPPLRKVVGVVVAAHAGGYARDGGFKPGDVIYSINNRRVIDLESLRAIVSELDQAAPLAVQIERLGRLRFLTLEIE